MEAKSQEEKIIASKLHILDVKYTKGAFPSSITIGAFIGGVMVYQKYFSDKREQWTLVDGKKVYQ